MLLASCAKRSWPALGVFSVLALPLAAQEMPLPAHTGSVPVQVVDFSNTPDIDLPTPPRSVLNVAPMGRTPEVPVGSNGLPHPNSPPTTLGDVENQPETGVFTIFRGRDQRPSGASLLFPGEPAAAQNRDCAFGTGNTYGSLSIDSGMTWSHVNPYTKFPAVDGGVCCDQRVIYIPSIDCTVWYIQYWRQNTATGRGGFRLAVSQGRNNLKNGTWLTSYWNTAPFTLLPAATWFDFPDIAFSAGYLYIATNVYDAASNYVNSVVMRQPLTTTQTGGGGGFSYYLRSGGGGPMGNHSYRFTQGGASPQAVMLWASHNTTASTRVYRWTDAGAARDADVNLAVPAWVSTTSNAPRPAGTNNWLGFDDHRIASGYITGAEAGWLWSSNVNGAGRPAPYVRVLRVNSATRALLANDDIFSGTNTQCWGYPAANVNSLGHKGAVMAYSSTTTHLTGVGLLVDNYLTTWFGQTLFFLSAAGTAGAPGARWGDYHQVSTHPIDNRTFIGTAMRQLNSSTSTANTEHRYIWFGRDDYTPAWVDLNVNSTGQAAVPVTIDVTDRNGLKNGTTNFVRSFTPRQGYELTVNRVIGSNLWDSFSGAYAGGIVSTTATTASLEVPDIQSATDTVNINYVPGRLLTVQSVVPTGVPITVSLADYFGAANGSTNFQRTYKNGQVTTLTAPASAAGRTFRRWLLDSVAQASGVQTLNVTMNAAHTAVAEYGFFTPGTIASLGVPCGGTSHTAGNPTPEIGEVQVFNMAGGTPNLALGAWCVIGWSNTIWAGIPLPLPLGFLQMPGCNAYIDHWLVLPRPTDAAGNASVGLGIINNTAFIGVPFYSQYFVRKAVNPAGLAATNYIRHTIGGWKVQ